MYRNRVIRFAEQDETSRIGQALSCSRLEGLKTTSVAEELLRKVDAGLISTEQAIHELKEYHQDAASQV